MMERDWRGWPDTAAQPPREASDRAAAADQAALSPAEITPEWIAHQRRAARTAAPDS